MVSTCSLAKDTYFVVFSFESISATIRAAIMSALYFLSLLLTASDIPRFLSLLLTASNISHFLSLLITASDISRYLYLFTVNIAGACVAVTAMPAKIRLWKSSMPAWTTTPLW